MTAPADITADVATLEAELSALVWAAEQRRGPGDGTGYESAAMVDLLAQAALLTIATHVHATVLRPFGAVELDGHLGADGQLTSALMSVHAIDRTYHKLIRAGTGTWRALAHLAEARQGLDRREAQFGRRA